MGRRRLYLILAAVLLLGVLAYALFWSPSEPSYGGRTLSQWLEMDFIWAVYNTPDALQEKARFINAISQIGTNAVPYLVKWINHEDPAWKKKLEQYLQTHFSTSKTADWLRHRLLLPGVRQQRATKAIEVLGPRGEEAIEGLLPLLKRKGESARYAAISLAYIGPKGVPPLLNALTNQQTPSPQIMAGALGLMGSNALPAIPALIQSLQATNSNVAGASAYALGRLGCQPELVVPALQATLKNSPREVYYRAILALGNFGPEARAAVPVLREMLNDTWPIVRKEASNALEKIEPHWKEPPGS